jgi:hypothetical protein
MHFLGSLSVICWRLAALASGQNQTNGTNLPVVDLGYEIYQAASFNVNFTFYTSYLNTY